MNDAAPVVVVGGGITGLTLAHGLARRGVNVRVLEAGEQPGGVIQSVARDGFLMELGPFTVMVRSPRFGELIQELGLSPVEVEAGAGGRRYVLHEGQLQLAPTSLMGLLRTPLLSVGGKARVLRGVVRSAARPQLPGGGDDQTLGQVAARRLGVEAAQRLAGAAAVGIFAAEADELSFDACFPALAGPDREGRSVVGMMRAVGRARRAALPAGAAAPPRPRRAMISFGHGLGELIAALGRELGDRVQTGRAVTAIQRHQGGYRVTDGVGTTDAAAVVLTVSPRVAASLVGPLVPAAAVDLEAIRLTGLGIVHLGMRREDVAHPLDGFGFLAPPGEACEPLLGSIWASSIFPHHAPAGHVLIRAIVGGTRWPGAMNGSDDELVAQTVAALRPLLGLRGEPVLGHVRRWRDAVPVYGVGHLARVKRIGAAVGAVPGLWCTGNWAEGLGVNDRVDSARRLADQIAASLSC